MAAAHAQNSTGEAGTIDREPGTVTWNLSLDLKTFVSDYRVGTYNAVLEY